MLSVVVGWQIYDLTDSALALGMIGLIQFLPSLLLTLISGEVADRCDRRTIVRWCYVIETVLLSGLMMLSLMDHPPIWAFYCLLLLIAIVGTFEGPAQQSLLPTIVPRGILRRAVAAYTSSSRIANLLSPAIGGLIYAFGPATDYLCCMVLVSIAAVASFLLPKPPALPGANQKTSWNSVLAGLVFIRGNPVLLGALSLDLVATFFGGLTALMPIFARDILDIGPFGLGILRSAPSVGALIAALVLSRYPINRSAGHVILGGVALYGVMTIVFAFSHDLALSLMALFLLGAGDTISQINRKTLIQAMTPDGVLGRVNAVSSLSVHIGGQLGQFESGVTAALFGAVGSALFGGVAVLLIVVLWAYIFPALRRVERADEVEAVQVEAAQPATQGFASPETR
jgi:MFS family permease